MSFGHVNFVARMGNGNCGQGYRNKFKYHANSASP